MARDLVQLTQHDPTRGEQLGSLRPDDDLTLLNRYGPATADLHVKVHPVLDGLGLWYRLEPGRGGIRSRLLGQGQAPERHQALRVGAVDRDLHRHSHDLGR